MYGGDPAKAGMAAAIALAESGGNSNAINSSNSNGSIDRGLFQINSIHGSNSTTDVASNVRYAIQLSKNGTDWTPWTVFKTGAYRRFLNGSPDLNTTPVDFSIPNPLDLVSGAINGIVDQLKEIIKAGEWFSDPHNLIRIVQVLIGSSLIIVGLVILNRSLIMDVVDTIT